MSSRKINNKGRPLQAPLSKTDKVDPASSLSGNDAEPVAIAVSVRPRAGLLLSDCSELARSLVTLTIEMLSAGSATENENFVAYLERTANSVLNDLGFPYISAEVSAADSTFLVITLDLRSSHEAYVPSISVH